MCAAILLVSAKVTKQKDVIHFQTGLSLNSGESTSNVGKKVKI